MSRYIVTSGSHFDPFTYDELAKPLIQATEVHNATADAYDKLSMETGALERYITDNPGDSKARAIYDGYKQKLQSLQDNLWKNGITAQTRRDLAAARAGYANDISRLESAIKARQERSQEYWKKLHDNPNLVASTDPGSAGLDAYLDDDQYGQNWWSYDTAQFEKDMQMETKMRAQEILRGLTDPNGVVRNPKLAGQLTRVLGKGFTNGEISEASGIVDDVLNMSEGQRQEYYRDNNVNPMVQLLSESLINRYDATGIRNQEVSDADRTRLINRGKAGWTAGVAEPEIKDFSDPYFAQSMAYSQMRYKYNLEHPDSTEPTGHLEDTHTTVVAGENGADTRKKLTKTFGPDVVRVTSKGKEVRGGAQASDLVYSSELRRKAFADLGFDIGRDPNHFASKNFLTGEVNLNGTVYETQYSPKANGGKGAVKYRLKGSNIDWNSAQISPSLTDKYNSYRTQYLDTLNYYKNSERDVYKMATVDPDKQYDLYNEYGVPADIPLSEASEYIMSQPSNSEKVTVKQTYVARSGTDSGKYIDRLSGLISESIPVDDNGETSKNRDWKVYDGQSGHIHALTQYGTLSEKTILNPGDVLHFNKDTGKIDNISNIRIDENSILNNYIVIGTTTSNQLYGIGLDMINSDQIKGLYDTARRAMYSVLVNPALSNDEKNQRVDNIVSRTSVQIKNILGYYTNTQSQGGTDKENKN